MNNFICRYRAKRKDLQDYINHKVLTFFKWAKKQPYDYVVKNSYSTIEILFVLLLAYGSYNCFTGNLPDGFLLGCVLAYMASSRIIVEILNQRKRIIA